MAVTLKTNDLNLLISYATTHATSCPGSGSQDAQPLIAYISNHHPRRAPPLKTQNNFTVRSFTRVDIEFVRSPLSFNDLAVNTSPFPALYSSSGTAPDADLDHAHDSDPRPTLGRDPGLVPNFGPGLDSTIPCLAFNFETITDHGSDLYEAATNSSIKLRYKLSYSERDQELKDIAYEAVRTSGELETSTELTRTNKSNCLNGEGEGEPGHEYGPPSPANKAANVLHFVTLATLGLLTLGIWWSAGGGGWQWGETALRLSGPPLLGWAGGRVFQSVGLPPQLAPLLAGVLARHFGYLDMRHYTDIDYMLRKIYPVVILGKAALGWDLSYMRSHWRRVLALGVLPWAAELSTVTVCTNVFLGFPCFWGVILGSIYASVSCAVLMPLMRRWKDGTSKVNWAQLVCTAGGTDTALGVGVCGLLLSYEFHEADNVYRYVKASLTLFAGVGLGAAWGGLACYIPHDRDVYVSELRVLYVLLGGLFFTFITLLLGWGGTGGVAVLACNSMAARQWARSGWTLGSNPVTTAYRVLWDVLEPMLFTYTGTYFVINKHTGETLLVGLAVLAISLTVRLTVASLVCWDFALKEKVYLCCTWIPKTIVEAVLCPVMLIALPPHRRSAEARYAEDIITLTIQAIFITTLIGFLLTSYIGTKFFPKHKSDSCENGL